MEEDNSCQHPKRKLTPVGGIDTDDSVTKYLTIIANCECGEQVELDYELADKTC